MSQSKGKVYETSANKQGEKYGYIEYAPTKDDPEDMDTRLYFSQSDVSGAFPGKGDDVTFMIKRHLDKEDDENRDKPKADWERFYRAADVVLVKK